MFEVGERHTRNTIIDWERVNGKIKYFVECDCGNYRSVRSDILKKNKWGCKDCANKYGRKKFGEEHSINSAWKSLKNNAKTRKILVDITKQDFVNIAKRDCFYCGEPPKEKIYYDQPDWSTPAKLNGIDRVDNSAGYTLDNSVPCCYTCNRGKMNLSLKEFRDWILKLSKREWINE